MILEKLNEKWLLIADFDIFGKSEHSLRSLLRRVITRAFFTGEVVQTSPFNFHLLSLLILLAIFFLFMCTIFKSPLIWGQMQEHIKCQGSHEETAQWTHSADPCFVLSWLFAELSYSACFSPLSIDSVTFVMVRAHWSAHTVGSLENSSSILGQ